MAKIKLKYRLENKSDNSIIASDLLAIKQNDIITYNEDGISVNIVFSNESVTIIRRCQEYKLELNLVNNEISSGIYYIENVGTFDLIIKTDLLEFSNNKIYAEYELTINNEVSKFVFSLEYEEIL